MFNEIIAAGSYRTFRRLLLDSGCRRCSLAEGRSRIVVDRGNPSASILAVGEGPGREEDRTGRAFVGRAGKLLDRLLLEAGLDAERDLLIANVVKCRPPGNRAPTKEEARRCLPYLRRQFELVAPRTVLLLGATALRHLFPGMGAVNMKDQAGRVFTAEEFPGMEFMVLFHPAYLLRDPRRVPLFGEHLAALRRRVRQKNGWPGR